MPNDRSSVLCGERGMPDCNYRLNNTSRLEIVSESSLNRISLLILLPIPFSEHPHNKMSPLTAPYNDSMRIGSGYVAPRYQSQANMTQVQFLHPAATSQRCRHQGKQNCLDRQRPQGEFDWQRKHNQPTSDLYLEVCRACQRYYRGVEYQRYCFSLLFVLACG